MSNWSIEDLQISRAVHIGQSTKQWTLFKIKTLFSSIPIKFLLCDILIHLILAPVALWKLTF